MRTFRPVLCRSRPGPTVLASLLAVVSMAFTAGPTNAQDLDLSDCRITAGPGFPGIKARCGTFERPEDPSRPDGNTITLAVAVVPALSLEPAADPLVPIAGGPGQGSIEFYAGSAHAFEQIRRERDIVLMDQRGTGDSAPMNCDATDDMASGDADREETVAATEACLAELPHDPRFFTTSVAVQDLDALCEALGYGQFNLYGISYGSRVAQHFLRRFPDATRSVILDGVVPPDLALGPAIATEAQSALDAIFARCAEDASCNAAFPELEQTFDTLLATLREAPVPVTLPHPSDGTSTSLDFGADELGGAIRLLSYHPTTIALIPFLVSEAGNGNVAPIAAQFLQIRDNLSQTIALGMHNAVACTEDAPYFDAEPVTGEELAAAYLGPLLRDTMASMCSVWPVGVIDADFKEPVQSSKPVLLLSGEADPITPPGYAIRAAVDFDNATLLTGAKQGHGLAPRGCLPDVISDFVTNADPDAIDAECLGRLFAMPFFLNYSGPAP